MDQTIESNCGDTRHNGIKHIMPFLVIPLGIALMRGFAHHKFTHLAEQRGAGWKNGVPPMFAELHRRAHAAEVAKPVETQA